MLFLSDELQRECLNILPKCSQFRDLDRLRGFLTLHEETYFLRAKLRLKNSYTYEELVEAVLPVLLEERHRDLGCVFPIILRKLCIYYEPSDELRQRLEELYKNVLKAVRNSGTDPKIINNEEKQKLLSSILQIDFSDQVNLAREAIDSYQTIGMLVHGQPACGQRELVNRIGRDLLKAWDSLEPIKIDLSSNGLGKDYRVLWYELTSRMDIPANTKIGRIIDLIFQKLESQDVVIILYGADSMPSNFRKSLIQEFWQPLVDSFMQTHKKQKNHLILFFVDNEGKVIKENPELVCIGTEIDIRLLLELPPATAFRREILEAWVSLALSLNVIPSGLSAQTLLEPPIFGIPQLVYQEICRHVDRTLSWEGEITRWLV